MSKKQNELDLMSVAARAGGFETFLGLAKRAGLEAKLQGAGPYTVFAPTDEAFAKAPRALMDKLNAPDQASLLRAVVAIHLVVGQVLTERLAGRRIRGKSVEGGELVISGAEAITVNGAAIVRPDVMASNGVLHGIDRVLWPKAALPVIEAVPRS